jgi:hypothetical protein
MNFRTTYHLAPPLLPKRRLDENPSRGFLLGSCRFEFCRTHHVGLPPLISLSFSTQNYHPQGGITRSNQTWHEFGLGGPALGGDRGACLAQPVAE